MQTISAGQRSMAVSWLVNRLTPDTTYHSRVVLITGAGTTASPFVKTYGRDLTFTTTHVGSLLLAGSRLSVKGGEVFAALRCASRLSCNGRFSITTRARLAGRRGLATIDCTKPNTTFFRIKARATRMVRAAVSRSCMSLLRGSRHGRHSAKFSSRPRTAQQGIIRNVVLILRG